MKPNLSKYLLYRTSFIVGLFVLSACANPNFVYNKVVKRKVHSKPKILSEPITEKKIEAIDSTTLESSKRYDLTDFDYYKYALARMNNMLMGKEKMSFKNAVYLTENAYYSDSLSYTYFNYRINNLKNSCSSWCIANNLEGYGEVDSLNFKKNASIYTLMKDTIFLGQGVTLSRPYEYNFSDFLAENDWSNQFVSTLINTKKGNCHSLPYLYKILADELDTKAYLSLAPNHIYIKQFSKKIGWYNTELTSGEFPTDAWIKASGYITIDAIKNGLYMDTLSEEQCITMCVYDLAKGYLSKTNNYSDGFVLQCCDIVLKYHPNNINAIILKAETLKKNYSVALQENNLEKARIIYTKMQKCYVEGIKLGYREMPLEMYQSWLLSLKEQKEKYVNSDIKTIFKEHE